MILLFVELTTTAADLGKLERFYHDLFVPSFPDPDERESLENMKGYLTAKRDGWYESLGEKNSYHILLGEADGRVVAAAIFDYLACPNVGILEFILVSEELRGRGFGGRVHREVERILGQDAQRAGYVSLDGIVIEMNDPFQVDLAADNVDPFERAKLWGGWDYEVMDFPYVQPALSEEQGPVTYLLLCLRRASPTWNTSIPAPTVAEIVYGYLKWAMRIDEPKRDPVYQTMEKAILYRAEVTLTPLLNYVGTDPAARLEIVPILDTGATEFAEAISVYERTFADGDTKIDNRIFRETIDREARRGNRPYHFWAIRDTESRVIAGMASFFTLAHAGFGGYIAFAAPLVGKGQARRLIPRIEERMVRDRPGVAGWYVECEPVSRQYAIFERLGFRPVSYPYRQPSLSTIDGRTPPPAGDTEMSLMYKPIGRRVKNRSEEAAALREDLTDIFQTVYRLPAADAAHRAREIVDPPRS